MSESQIQRKTMPAMEMDIKQKPPTGLWISSVNFQSLFMKHNSGYKAMAISEFPQLAAVARGGLFHLCSGSLPPAQSCLLCFFLFLLN